jgi:hypothetical protein
MWNDPIVEEIREIRRQIWAEHGNDLKRLYDHYVELQKTRPAGVVTMPGQSKLLRKRAGR